MYRSFVSLVRIRVACRRGRRCGRQGLPRFRLRRYEIIRNLRMPDRARNAFFPKILNIWGASVSTRSGPARRRLQDGRGWVSAGSGVPRLSCPVRRAVFRVLRAGAEPFRSWPAEPPLCGRSLAVKRRTVLRTVAGRIKKVVPSWEIRINLCNFVIRGVVSFREGGSCGSFCFT